MKEKVKEQILAIRDSGLMNLFDVKAVQKIAHDKGFYDLVVFIEEHKEKYVRFILGGNNE